MTLSKSAQDILDANHAIDRACSNDGGRCLNQASLDVTVQLDSGQSVTLRLCATHGPRTIRHGVRNGEVTGYVEI